MLSLSWRAIVAINFPIEPATVRSGFVIVVPPAVALSGTAECNPSPHPTNAIWQPNCLI